MAWNGSGNVNQRTPPKVAKKRGGSSGLLLGLLALIAVGAGVAWFALQSPKAEETDEPVEEAAAEPVEEKKADPPPSATVELSKEQEIARSLSDQAAAFVKHAPTNNIKWIVPPLDPDDPDNALRTGVMQQLGSLLSVPPGDEMPPFPYSFLIEDDLAKMAEENGEAPPPKSRAEDNNFMESLKKWKITIKDTDSDRKAEHKTMLIDAQIEMLNAMDEGLTANDVIRQAYEYRKRAYEMKTETAKTLHEMYDSGEMTKSEMKTLLDEMNSQLQEKGITTIHPSDIGFETDENGEPIIDDLPIERKAENPDTDENAEPTEEHSEQTEEQTETTEEEVI